jgi:hypothetical protein
MMDESGRNRRGTRPAQKLETASEGLDLSSFSVSPQLVQAVYELAAFLERMALRDEANPRTPAKSATGS